LLNNNDANVIERRQVIQNSDDFYKMHQIDENEPSEDEAMLEDNIIQNKKQFGSIIARNNEGFAQRARRPPELPESMQRQRVPPPKREFKERPNEKKK
jgi:hypothetical protein